MEDAEDWSLLSDFASEPCFSKSVADGFSGGGSQHVFRSNFGEDEFTVNNNDEYGFNDSSLVSVGSRLPCLTIPSGLIPDELLDSPVMLPNSQLSPTTGTMMFSPPEMLKSSSISSEKEQDGDDVSSYELKPPWPGFAPSQTQNFQTEDDCQRVLAAQSVADYAFPVPLENLHRIKSETNGHFSTSLMAETGAVQPSSSSHSYGIMKESHETVQLKDVKREQSSDGVYNGLYSTMKTSEDGYNWRKYGQKQVKGSDYPRSYYKCTHLTCPVKKKVERSHDGEITEIIYKGAHNHPKPQPSRRSSFGSTEPMDSKAGFDWRSQGLDIQCVSDISDPHSKPIAALESAQTQELSSTLASHDEEEYTTTQGSLADDDVETETKRRKKESSLIESALSSRALREPRVVVQIESEIDIVDDGYRWRKYGQKVVKGNPNPRSYYKCTSVGCTVRKHVERASHDLKFVLTTYEGKHNHEVPAARNSNNTNSSNGNLPPSSSPSQSTLTLPRNSHLPKAEPQDFVPPFNRKLDYDSEFLRSDYLGGFSCPPSSLYHQMKFPRLPSSGLYGGFGLNHNYTSSAQSMIPSVGDLSIPLPLPLPLPINYQLPSSYSMGAYDLHGMPLNPVPRFFMGQQMNDSDVKLVRPKQEQRD